MNTSLYNELPAVLTAKDLAKLFQISRASSYALFHAEGFPTLMIGNSKRVTRDDLIAWMNAKVKEDLPDYLNL